mmetsp:Transcript_24165/g.61818  ORF Transcript_24165/g.61818 Transcript_24165/m.61818 type:complete len:268 (+) Transcript_24165:426-1229(+)
MPDTTRSHGSICAVGSGTAPALLSHRCHPVPSRGCHIPERSTHGTTHARNVSRMGLWTRLGGRCDGRGDEGYLLNYRRRCRLGFVQHGPCDIFNLHNPVDGCRHHCPQTTHKPRALAARHVPRMLSNRDRAEDCLGSSYIFLVIHVCCAYDDGHGAMERKPITSSTHVIAADRIASPTRRAQLTRGAGSSMRGASQHNVRWRAVKCRAARECESLQGDYARTCLERDRVSPSTHTTAAHSVGDVAHVWGFCIRRSICSAASESRRAT